MFNLYKSFFSVQALDENSSEKKAFITHPGSVDRNAASIWKTDPHIPGLFFKHCKSLIAHHTLLNSSRKSDRADQLQERARGLVPLIA